MFSFLPKPRLNIVKKRILVVDDTELNRKLLLKHIESLNNEGIQIDVAIALDGLEAINKVKNAIRVEKQPFDLVIMDFKMPGVDGVKATKQIRKFSATRIFLCTSNPEDLEDSKKKIFSGMLTKPFNRSEIEDLLRKKLQLPITIAAQAAPAGAAIPQAEYKAASLPVAAGASSKLPPVATSPVVAPRVFATGVVAPKGVAFPNINKSPKSTSLSTPAQRRSLIASPTLVASPTASREPSPSSHSRSRSHGRFWDSTESSRENSEVLSPPGAEPPVDNFVTLPPTASPAAR